MGVTNSTRSDVLLFVSDRTARATNGLSPRIPPPSTTSWSARGLDGARRGDPQYFEVKASSSGGDTCASDTSEFKLEVTVGDNITIGTVDITERWNTYHGSSSNSDLMKANVGDGGDQDRIEVTIVPKLFSTQKHWSRE